jgi:hypothetical protein
VAGRGRLWLRNKEKIGHASGLPISQVGSLLLMMELKGLVRQVAPGQYAKV